MILRKIAAQALRRSLQRSAVVGANARSLPAIYGLKASAAVAPVAHVSSRIRCASSFSGKLSTSVLSTLPEHYIGDIRGMTNELLKNDPSKIIVLDDDPTGTQTVHGVNVLFDFSVEAIAHELASKNSRVLYLLTNTRSMNPEDAFELTKAVARNIAAASRMTYSTYKIVSRSDSTLRGHFPTEVDAIASGINMTFKTLIVPAFLEGGRVTFNDIHYVTEGDQLIPVGQTPFAKDPAFGFKSSNLKEWVQEKTRGYTKSYEVKSISIEDIRVGGPQHIARVLSNLTQETMVVVNIAHQQDMNVFVAGVLQAEADGSQFVYRTAASFIPARAGMAPRALLTRREIFGDDEPHRPGLIVVGSYVPKTSKQLEELLRRCDVQPVELNVRSVIEGKAEEAIQHCKSDIDKHLAAGKDVVLFTSRETYHGDSAGGLHFGKLVSDALTEIVGDLQEAPSFIVAKGGITSHDIAERSLGVRKALVLGQISPGVPVWKTEVAIKYREIPYVVFPGNVGSDNSLVDVARTLGVGAANHEAVITLPTDAFSADDSDVMKVWPSDYGRTVSIVRTARAQRKAVAAFNIYNFEGAKAVVDVANKLRAPVILQAHPAALAYGGVELLRMLTALRDASAVPMSVHLDHATDERHVHMALHAGVDSIMIDGSDLPFEKNMAWTAKMTEMAHNHGVAVEAELGKLVGEEDGLSVPEREGKMTNPAEVPLFVKETGVDLLAVTIGNVHGRYKTEPELDLQRLAAIRAVTHIPLVLHGASGLKPQAIHETIKRGVCKFNVNTDLRDAYVQSLKEVMAKSDTKFDLLPGMKATTLAMQEVVQQKIKLFGWQ